MRCSSRRRLFTFRDESDEDSSDDDSVDAQQLRARWWADRLTRRAPQLATGDGTHGTPTLFGVATNYGATRGLSAGVFYSLFRFAPPDAPRLVAALGIPTTIEGHFGKIDGEEAFLVYLRRLARADNLLDLKLLFNRSVGALSGVINAVGNHLVPIALAKLEHYDGIFWASWLPVFAAAIYEKGAPLTRCFEFIDGTFVAMCRPGNDGYNLQRVYYSGSLYAI